MRREPPQISVSIWSNPKAVEKVVLSHSDTFSYQIYGPRHNLDSFFDAYLEGKNGPLPPFDLASLTPFTKKVLTKLAEVPFGKTCTYGELASAIGNSKGARPVGGALGRNPFPLLLPCHRVLAQGGLGGFSAGISLKPLLLKYESLF